MSLRRPGVRVDWRCSLGLVGRVLKYLAVPLLIPLLVALFYGDGGEITFTLTAVIAVGVGSALERLDPDPELGSREGFLMVALTWLVVSLVGAVPYLIAGNGIPGLMAGSGSTVAEPVNAVFESMSGYTTTGATVMGEISFDRHSHALLIYRQMTQWLGGMGIVVLAVAILPELSVGGAQLMDAEAPGPGIEKLTPRIAETARALWVAYLGITLLEMGLLYALHLAGMAPNMGLYNAVAHGFTTMSTGGFSPEARSIEAFSAVVQWVIVPFMVAAGTNFALFWHVLQGDVRTLTSDAEFRAYAGILGVVTAVLASVLFVDPLLTALQTPTGTLTITGDAGESLRQAAFQAVSITTSTGYASMDFNQWSGWGQYVLVFAMFVGGMAGSTGGGIKIVRWVVILKSIRRELFATVHPDAVRPVRLGGRPLDERTIRGIYSFTLVYVAIFLVGALAIAVDGARVGEDTVTPIVAITASAATVGNIGPGLGAVGPMENYEFFRRPSKILMIGLMWLGRLEIIPVLVLLTRDYWRS
jgi:trk system potassium uptake protein TrkH